MKPAVESVGREASSMNGTFRNPLVFDEEGITRSNILNEMLHGQYEDVFR